MYIHISMMKAWIRIVAGWRRSRLIFVVCGIYGYREQRRGEILLLHGGVRPLQGRSF